MIARGKRDVSPGPQRSTRGGTKKIRYAVVGQGWISQAAVLPAFANAKKNSELAALVSGHENKLDKLGRKYKVQEYTYDQYDQLLHSGEIDAVFIALPNSMHHEYTIRAAEAGIHVLCEKPMAVTEQECMEMIEACERNNVKLMIAYRLHFEEANMRAAELIRNGDIGEPRLFDAIYSYQVEDGNIRTKADLGGGPMLDIGIYCLNAARYLFQDEPTEVFAFSSNNDEPRFSEVDEAVCAVMRFPLDRLAMVACSFGVSSVSYCRVVGTKGDLRLEPAFNFSESLKQHLTVNERTSTKTFSQRDQFAPELIYFSECILNDQEPEPSGYEGMIDVRIINAIQESIESGLPVKLEPIHPPQRPGLELELRRPPVRKPKMVYADDPHEE